jgi:hypothetical protein
MKCKLCLRDCTLSESHIIPKFLYKPGYDENGQMLALEKGESKAKNLQHQEYVYEKLLCPECDGFLNQKYEKYFYKLWYLDKTLPIVITSDFLEISNIDYTAFKLFHLSILWRASVSSLMPYKTVLLEKEQEERIRKMLLICDPGQPYEYQIFGALLQSPGTNNVLDGFITSPILREYDGLPIYMFVFGGCAWHYIIGDRMIEEFLPFSLSASGSLRLRVRDLQYVTPITRFIIEDVSRMRLPKRRKMK